VADTKDFRGVCQFGSRESVDTVIGVLGNLRSSMRDTRKVNHRLDLF
jgi:hypothetical protein